MMLQRQVANSMSAFLILKYLASMNMMSKVRYGHLCLLLFMPKVNKKKADLIPVPQLNKT